MNTSRNNCFAGRRRKSNSGVRVCFCWLCWTAVFEQWGTMALFLDCPVAVLKRPSEGQLSAFSWSLLKNSLWSTSSYSSLLSCSKVFFCRDIIPLMRKVVLLTVTLFLRTNSSWMSFILLVPGTARVLKLPANIPGSCRQKFWRDQASCYTTLANYWCWILVFKKLLTKGISQPKLPQVLAAPGCLIKVLCGDQRSLHPLKVSLGFVSCAGIAI